MNTPHTPTVAVIDGDTSRYPFVERLERDGHIHVVVFDSGRTALRQSSFCQASFLLINSQLPDMRGIDCVEMLVALYPDARFYLISDHYDADEERMCFRFARVKYLCRPLDEQWLSRLLRSVTIRRNESVRTQSPHLESDHLGKPHASRRDVIPRASPE